MHRIAGRVGVIAGGLSAIVLALGCAAPAPEPDALSATVWGYVRLVPRADVPRAGGYGDRRLADAKRVDYSHTKYAVVFVPTAQAPDPTPRELVVRTGPGGPRLEPAIASSTLEAGVRITNATGADQIVSAPDLGWLRRIAPGQTLPVDGLTPGELTLHLLGLPDAQTPEPTQVFIARGSTAEVAASGRYTLRGLPPGRHELRAWHPRLPPSAALSVELTRGSVRRVDLEIGLEAGALQGGAGR